VDLPWFSYVLLPNARPRHRPAFSGRQQLLPLPLPTPLLRQTQPRYRHLRRHRVSETRVIPSAYSVHRRQQRTDLQNDGGPQASARPHGRLHALVQSTPRVRLEPTEGGRAKGDDVCAVEGLQPDVREHPRATAKAGRVVMTACGCPTRRRSAAASAVALAGAGTVGARAATPPGVGARARHRPCPRRPSARRQRCGGRRPAARPPSPLPTPARQSRPGATGCWGHPSRAAAGARSGLT